MCGRYTLTTDLEELIEVFQVPEAAFDHGARFNIAPSQMAPVVARDRRGTRMGPMRWGLIPFWAEDATIGGRLINARSESIRDKPAFRDSFVRRRCLVPADGFYEWARLDGSKQPYWIHPASGGVVSFAGVWDRWMPKQGGPIHSFAILTGAANEQVGAIHDRMPVIMPPDFRDRWMDRAVDREEAAALLREVVPPELATRPVSTWVNHPAHDDPGCIEPVEP